MKRPEEIRTAIASCFHAEDCIACPYNDEQCAGVITSENLIQDMSAYIDQLEERIAKRDKLLATLGVKVLEENDHEKD